MKRTICVVTATRAEYGLLRWLMHDIRESAALTLQCLVTGAHLSNQHGLTYKDIERDGFFIDASVEMLLGSDTELALTKSMAICMIGVGEALARLRPDLLVVLGDRYELLAICSAATMLNVPIVHISGGDLTLGAVDNQIRHAVTKLAHLHFPGTEESAARIIQMGEEPSRVFSVGEPGLDNFLRTPPIARDALAATLGLDPGTRWVMFTLHPETLGAGAGVDAARADAALDVLAELSDVQTVMTAPNADSGGLAITAVLEKRAALDPARFKMVKSLGHDRFVSFLREAWAMVGNSSAGIVEAPAVQLPVVNIGARQRGRQMPRNVITVDGTSDALRAAFTRLATPDFRASIAACESPYGDGNTARRIVEILARVPLDGLLRKPFHAPDRR